MIDTFFHKRLLPAVTIDGVDAALQLAETYLEAGLDVMEITFRTEAAPSAIESISKTFPEMNIGAGTLLAPAHIHQAKESGAQFGLAPGFNENVVDAAKEAGLPFIPGVSTPSEIEKALESGCTILKLFPADLLGGLSYIRSLEGPYRETGVRFIPMGGLNLQNLKEYLQYSIVLAAGGSWIAPGALIKESQFEMIGDIVRKSLTIVAEE